jgi:hypothetical protein
MPPKSNFKQGNIVSIIQIQKVQREGARVLVMLCGVSGCGKTYTAIQLAYGMANGDANKVGFLDTENGRGKFYADTVPDPFLYGELKPPFSPARYIQAIEEFSKTGVEVLIIDSGSHEFEGIGGIQDIAEAGNPKLPNWNRAKGEHKKFMSALLNSPMHIILCLRAREKAKPERQFMDGREKTVYVDLGLQPITEKNVVFEATASLMLHDQGMRHDSIKVPAALQGILGRGEGYLNADDGKALRAWVDGAKQLDPKVEHAKGVLQLAAEQGMEALKAAWGGLPKGIQKAIGGTKGCPETYKASAEAFDQALKDSAGAAPDPAFDALNTAAAQVQSMPAAEPEQQPEVQQAAQTMQEPAPAGADDGEVF